MSGFKEDMARVQQLVGNAFTATGGLVALADGAQMQPTKLRKALEQTMGSFEAATLELRQLCERYMPPTGSLGKKPTLPRRDVTGSVELIEYQWLHITIHTLLPSAAYQTPVWLSDTIRRLLDEYESGGHSLPYYRAALMVIEERSDIEGRRVFDQDNKGYKTISNAIKGRLIPDDDQYTLGVALLSARSSENACHITLLDSADAADYFALRAWNSGF